jgi:hypothetical protein
MRASLLSLVLLASVCATASTLAYQVSFSSNTLIPDCGIVCPPSPLPPGMSDSWTATFQLPSVDLATNGLYDVSLSFNSAKIFLSGGISGLVMSGAVAAQVSGGAVTDFESSLHVNYGWTAADFPVIMSLSAAGGLFRLDSNVTVIKTDISAEDGTFTIQELTTAAPEPASATLLLLGGATCLLRRRRLG